MAKTQERKTKRQKGYNSTWHDKQGLGLSTQTWHGVHKHIEDGIKHIDQISKETIMWRHRHRHRSIEHAYKHVDLSKA